MDNSNFKFLRDQEKILGKDFNKIVNSSKFTLVSFFHKSNPEKTEFYEYRYSNKFVLGLNILPTKEEKGCALTTSVFISDYHIDEEKLATFSHCYFKYCMQVSIPDDAILTNGRYDNEWFTDRIIINDEVSEIWYIEHLHLYPYWLRHIKNQTNEMCMNALKINDKLPNYAKFQKIIKYIINPTEEMCLMAVKQSGYAIRYIQNPTNEMIRFALKDECFEYIKNPSIFTQLLSVAYNGRNLYTDNNSFKNIPEMRIAAAMQDGNTIGIIKDKNELTHELCIAAVKEDAYAIQFIDNQTMDICFLAVRNCGYTIDYVKDQTPELCFAALEQTPFALRYIKNPTYDMCLFAVKKNGYTLPLIENITEEIFDVAILTAPYFEQYRHFFLL